MAVKSDIKFFSVSIFSSRCAESTYQIEKKSTGFYQLLEFKAEPTVIEKLELNFRRDERVIRYITVKLDKYAAEYAAKRKSVKQAKAEEA